MQRQNYCENWVLYCNSMKKTDKGVVLKCSKRGKKSEGSAYPPTLWIDVICNGLTTDMEQVDYTKQYALVSGDFSFSEWITNDGISRLNYVIFASKVERRAETYDARN